MEADKAYENYKEEAETYFITKFLDSVKMAETIKKALTVTLNLNKEPLKKGVMLYSKGYGQGKTLFFNIVSHRANRLKNIKLYTHTSAKELAEIFAKKGQDALNQIIECRNLFIDDLGEEEVSRKHYGDEMNVLTKVLLKRYELWVEKNYCTYLTTNLTLEEIAERYDGKVSDRILQMTEPIEFTFTKNSLRQTNKSRLKAESEKPKEEIKEVVFDEKKHDANFLSYLNGLVKEAKIDKLEGVDYLDFWVIHNYLEGKKYPIPELTPDEEDTAKGWYKKDLNYKLQLIRKRSAVDVYNKSHNNEVCIKAMKAKKIILTLAKNKTSFSETDFT